MESFIDIILSLILLCLLVSYLFLKHWERENRELKEADPSTWTGPSFDAAKLLPLIARIRQDYFATLPFRKKDSGFHKRLCALIRNAIRQTSYFKHSKNERTLM